MKTLSIIAIAGLASAAGAQVLQTGSVAGNGNANLTSFASGTYVYEFGNTDHWDLQGDPDNVIVSLDLNALLGGVSGADAFVTGIGWDVTVESFGASWLSEASYSFNGEVFLAPGTDDEPGIGSYSSPPVILADLAIPDITASGGILNIEFFESFDDVADAIDAVSSGSLTLLVDYKPVPAPAGLAVLGLGGLAAARRRR